MINIIGIIQDSGSTIGNITQTIELKLEIVPQLWIECQIR